MNDLGYVRDENEAIELCKGNWRKFQSFGWDGYRYIDDADNWFIFYTHHRDSTLLDQSNSEQWKKILEPYLNEDKDNPDIYKEHHGHFGYGWIDGYSVRVVDETGQMTPVFRKIWETFQQLADYPLLDESDYSSKEYEATIENIRQEGNRVARKYDYELPEDWESEVFSWLWDHNQRAVESRDDQGGYPDEDSLIEAFDELEYECFEEIECTDNPNERR